MPIVARKYSIENGTLRYFEPIFSSREEYKKLKPRSRQPRVIFYLAESDDDNGGCGEAGTFNYASTVSFPATALTTYVIEWTDHWSAAPFEFFIGEVVNGVSNDDTSFGAVKAMFR